MTVVSIVIPFHERIDWTKEAIRSVLSQTFQDFEIVVIDDGSEKEYKKEIEELDRRIIYVRQSNRGVSAARNMGIQQSSGEFIAFLDSDDLFLPEKLKMQLSLMEAQSDILLSHTSYNQVNTQQEFLQVIHSGLFTGNVYPGILAHCPIATPTVMVRRAALANLKFCEEIHVAEDLLLWSQLSKRSTIIGIDIPLTNVRIHGSNAAMDSKKQLQGLSNIVKYGLDQDASIARYERNAILYNIYHHTAVLRFRQKQFISTALNLILAFQSRLSSFESFPEKVKFLFSPLTSPHKSLKYGVHTLMYTIARKILPKHIRQSLRNLVIKSPSEKD